MAVNDKTGNVVLCGANSYDEKFYISDDFKTLPNSIKDELNAMCVLFTEEVGGILTLEFEEDGTLVFQTIADEFDYLYDDVSCALKLHQMQVRHRDLFEALETYYRVFFLGEQVPEEIVAELEAEAKRIEEANAKAAEGKATKGKSVESKDAEGKAAKGKKDR